MILLLAVAVAVPVSGSMFRATAPAVSSGLSTAISLGFGGPATTELQSVYNNRTDLQAAFPNAFSNFTNYTKLVSWAGGTVTNQWVDSNYTLLEPYGYFYALMAAYNARADLRADFPHAYKNFTHFTELVDWAAGVVGGASPDGAYSALAEYGYWYALMSTYNDRADLQAAFPNAYTNAGSYASLVSWAGGVVTNQWNDGSYATLAPFGYYYALMGTYNARTDLQAAFPDAYGNYTNFSHLVSWADGVVSGASTDGAYSALEPFGYWYVLTGTYNARPDLQAAYPEAYSDLDSFSQLVGWADGVVSGQWADGAYGTLAPYGYYFALLAEYNARSDLQSAYSDPYTSWAGYTGLVEWAGGVVTGASSDAANDALQPFGYYYALMSTYNGRTDLQSAFPEAYTDFVSYSGLVDWAGNVVTGVFYDGSYSTLSPFGFYYDMMGVYDSRPDLQTTFPLAYSDWSSELGLGSWAGAVVNSSIVDPSDATLEPFGYWYVLYGWVYEPRSDLQTLFPLAWTEPSSSQALLAWAKEVVNGEIVDNDFLTLVPFTASYDLLG